VVATSVDVASQLFAANTSVLGAGGTKYDRAPDLSCLAYIPAGFDFRINVNLSYRTDAVPSESTFTTASFLINCSVGRSVAFELSLKF
jgi:hypothetical protein